MLGDPVLLGLAALVTLLAAGVQGVTGFGHALLAIGFLSLLYGARDAILLLTLLAPAIAIVVFLRLRKDVDWRETAWLGIPVLVASVPGIWLFQVLPTDALRRVVGVLLIVFTVWFASPLSPSRRRLARGWTLGAGVAAGFLGGLTSTGGPPLVLYLLVQDLEKRTSIAVLQAVFLLGSVGKVLLVGGADLLTVPLLARSGLLMIPLVAGVLLGQLLFDRIDAKTLRWLSLGLLGAMGIALTAGL
jgi:uncharacterized membrane protein YfcA